MAPAHTRTGQTSCGRGWRRQSVSRWPSQTIGAVPPAAVHTMSPRRNRSTATAPRVVAMRVPAAKQGASSVPSAAAAKLAPALSAIGAALIVRL